VRQNFEGKQWIKAMSQDGDTDSDLHGRIGKDIPTMNYKEELEHWGHFGSLEVNKATSRLSLFTSQAASMHTLSATNDFEMIPERFNVGCGFIPKETIDAMSPRSRLVVIQIHLLSPLNLVCSRVFSCVIMALQKFRSPQR
jgi:hypothetical protein